MRNLRHIFSLFVFLILIGPSFANVQDISFPQDWDGVGNNPGPIACDEYYPEDSEGNPHPDLTGYPVSSDCSDLGISYDDQILPVCGGVPYAHKILREWVVIDWCSGITHTHEQLIKIADEEAPELSGSNSITVSVGTNYCYYILDEDDFNLSFSDNCDYYIEKNFVPPIGTSLSKGTHNVTVQLIDDCNNVGNYNITVYVEDHVPPIAVVDNNFNVSLSSDGTAYIYKTAFDEGSHDQCGPVNFEVRRINANPCGLSTEWGHSVEFCCEDIPISPVTVEFRVLDHSGNSNTSWIQVYVEDKLSPNVNCPPDVTLECLDDYYPIINNAGVPYQDLPQSVKNTLGNPTFTSGCSAELTYSVLTQINQCATSYLDVTWIVQTEGGQSDGCLQEVTIIRNDENKLNCDDIYYPSGTLESQTYGTFPWCAVNDNQNDPDDDIPAIQIMDCGQANINYPLVDNNFLCTSIGVSRTLDTFHFADGVCKKILAHWEIIDFCTFEANYVDPITGEIDPFNSNNGYFEFFAEYDIFDSEGPEVTCNEVYNFSCDETFSGPITATAIDNCSNPNSFGWSWQWDEDNDGDIDYEGPGASITASNLNLSSFNEGIHKLLWNVNDGCGNNTQQTCIIEINSVDTKPPTPYCHLSLSTVVMEGVGEVTLWASDFDAGSFDNCTPQEELTFSFSPSTSETSKTFDCNTLGFNFVPIWVTDAEGNQDFCQAFLTVMDNGHCAELSVMAGRVRSENGVGVENALVEMQLNGETIGGTVSGENGEYEFEAYWTEGTTITAQMDGQEMLGINTLDLLDIQKHIVGADEFDSPYQMIAADINASENITVFDIVHLRRLILGYYEELPENKPWYFVHAGQEFDDLSQVNSEFNEFIDLSQSRGSLDFVAVKTGDVNSSYDTELQSAEVRESIELEYSLNETGDAILIRSTKNMELSGFQMEILFNSAELSIKDIQAGELSISEENYYLREGQFSLSFHTLDEQTIKAGETLLALSILQKNKVTPILSIDNSRIPSELYSNGKTKNISLREAINISTVANSIPLVKPNPFSGFTNVSIEVNEDKPMKIKLVDQLGELMHSETVRLVKGMNELTFRNSQFPSSGVYYLQIQVDDQLFVRKLIKLE